MRELIDTVIIGSEPKNIFQYFVNIEKNYRYWHPDHISWNWVWGKPLEIGSKAVIREYLHGEIHTFKAEITYVKPDERIEYRFLFPSSLLVRNGYFNMKRVKKGCIFTVAISFRFGFILSKLFKKRVSHVIGHMREEGENLKQILEKK